MKRTVLTFAFCLLLASLYSQSTYYWTGGAGPVTFSTNSNWNTAPDGSGSNRTGSALATDILIIDGSNIGGASAATGTVTANISSTACGQLKLVNHAVVVFQRPAGGGGTGTLTISGGSGDDFIIEGGSSLGISCPLADGNVVIALAAGATGLIGGSISLSNTGQHRITNQGAGALVFTNGASFTTNITSTSASYPFGSSSQSVEKGVVFQAGAHLYYDGGYSPMGNSSTFSSVNFLPGSYFHIRASNPVSGSGSFFNQKIFSNISVENNAVLTADGPIYKIDTLIIGSSAGCITHTSGQTVVLGDMTVNGSFTAPAGSTNTLVLAGIVPQTVSGAGTITVPSLTIADQSNVNINKNISTATSVNVYGKMNCNASQLSGAASFTSRVNNTSTALAGNTTTGSYQLTGVTGTISGITGLTISGTGIAPNTTVVAFSASSATINLSQPMTATATGVALAFSSGTATLATAHANGFDSTTGSIIVTGAKTYQAGTNYIINAATASPFGISSGTTAPHLNIGSVDFNAGATTNYGVSLSGNLTLNSGRLTIRAGDTVRLASGVLNGSGYSNAKCIVSAANNSTGAQGIFRWDNISAATLFPIASAAHYLPVTITPSGSSDIAIAVFEGLTNEATPNGTPFAATQLAESVNAVWNINRVNGSGAAGIVFNWDAALEGSAFSTLSDGYVGIASFDGTSWSLPVNGTGSNSANTVSASFNSGNAFYVGKNPQAAALSFNPLPVKTYGDADFAPGAVSTDNSTPIVYTSSNTAAATIVSGNIHITGAGATIITATQGGNQATQQLTVSPTPLTITADNKSKYQGDPNPALTVSYTGFVYNQTAASLLTAPVITTTAVTGSPIGNYPITVSGAASANYTITYVSGVLSVTGLTAQTISFPALAPKTYGDADFSTGATSTNSSIPITYKSSNTAVAIISGGNIHITGAGTATVTASQAGIAPYSAAADVQQTLTVSKAPLGIRPADKTKTQGEANPALTVSYTGFVNGENANALSAAPVVSTTATVNSLPGEYPIVASGAVSSNYAITYTNGILTVYPAGGTTQPSVRAYNTGGSLLVRLYNPGQPLIAAIKLYDMNGRQLRLKKAYVPNGFTNVSITGMRPPAGIYIVKAEGAGINLHTTINIP